MERNSGRAISGSGSDLSEAKKRRYCYCGVPTLIHDIPAGRQLSLLRGLPNVSGIS
jgi:hypothetical protein